MYPDDRMLRDRMLGSMIVSSASGVLRMRPEMENNAESPETLPEHSGDTSPFILKFNELLNDIKVGASDKQTQECLLTYDQLFNLLPLNVIASFMGYSNCNSPLDPLLKISHPKYLVKI